MSKTLSHKMKVILFSPLNQVGGIAVWTQNVISYLSEIKNKSIIHVDASLQIKNDANKMLFYRICRGVVETPRLYLKLYKAINTYKPSVVWRSCSGSLGFFRELMFAYLCRSKKIKSVIHLHFGRIPQLCMLKNWEYRVMKKVIELCDYCIVIDSPSFHALSKLGYSNKIRLIPNPCSEEIKDIAKSQRFENKSETYVFVGQIIPTKGVFELVNAFTIYKDTLLLKLVGPYTDNIKKELLEIAKSKSNGRWLTFTGAVSQKEVTQILQESTALVFPTYTEGFPNVVLEAMACGCPVLASNVAAIPSMLEPNSDYPSGCCFKPKSIIEITNTLDKFRKEKDLVSFYSNNGKAKVLSYYTMEKILPQYLSILDNLD